MTEPTTSTPLYNGLITFGTPHQGAAAANTLVDNQQLLNSVLHNACQKLAAGPLNEEINNSGVLASVAVMFGFGGGILNEICDAGVGDGFSAILSFAEQGLEDEITTTAATSIPEMATDNNAVFYGIEHSAGVGIDVNDPTLTPRFIGALLNPPSSFPLYGADASDELGIAEVASQLDFYVSKMNFWYDIDDMLCPDHWWILWCTSSAEPIADGYKEGVDWFATLDPTWKELIGATGTEVVQTGCSYSKVSDGWGGHAGHCDEYLGFEADCNPSYGYDCEDPVYQVQSFYKPSDGFILAESAMDGPGMNYEAKFMDGSNHLQMKNDSQMDHAIYKIFHDGIEEDRNFFNTDER